MFSTNRVEWDLLRHPVTQLVAVGTSEDRETIFLSHARISVRDISKPLCFCLETPTGVAASDPSQEPINYLL
jgi:hypothetical protein